MPRRTRPRCGPTWRSAGSTTASRSTRRAGSLPTTPSSPSRPRSSWTAPGGCATAPSARSRTTGWCSGSADCPDASVYDPFRLQLLTLSLDSQVVLVVFGIMLAGLAARVAARSQGLRAAGMPGLILDGALWALLGLGLIGGRPALAWPAVLGALAVERGLAWWLGHDWADGLVAALVLLVLVLLSRLVRARTPYEGAVSSEGVRLSRG